MYDLRIENGSVWLNDAFVKTNLYVQNGIFAKISTDILPAKDIIDARERLIIPGLIDPHVHFALQCGKRSSRDDFYSGSVSAAFGGVTTYIDFLDPTDNAVDLEKSFYRRLEEAKESVVDYKFHACIKNPKGDLEAYVKKMLELGMTSVKLFTTYSDSGRRTDDPEIKALLRLSEKYGFLVTAHIENDDMIRHDPQFTYRDLTTSRPSSAETTEALKLAGFVGECGGTLYMVHCSSGNTLAALKKQYPHLLNRKLFVESCPHYFLFTSDKLQGADGSLYTMAPPLRSESERQKLIELFPELTAIGTDHCPFLTEEKQQKSLDLMPLGIGGIEQAFSVLYPHFGNSLISRMTDKTARIHRINPKKGSIAAGADADFFILHLEQNQTMQSHHSRCDYDLFRNLPIAGTIESTVVRGRFVVRNGQFMGGHGHWIREE